MKAITLAALILLTSSPVIAQTTGTEPHRGSGRAVETEAEQFVPPDRGGPCDTGNTGTR